MSDLSKLSNEEMDALIKDALTEINKDGIPFMHFISIIFSEKFDSQRSELIKQFDRLYKTNVGLKLPPLLNQIDLQSGFFDKGAKMFILFIYNVVFSTFSLENKE